MNVSCPVSILNSVQNAHQLQQHTIEVCSEMIRLPYPRHSCTRLIDPMANRLQRVQAPVFVRITRSYRFSPESLVVKPVNIYTVSQKNKTPNSWP